MKLNVIYFIILILSQFPQTVFSNDIDTVNIHQNKTGISFRTYKKIWFPVDGSYGYKLDKVNKQDSLILSKEQYYFKVYNKKGILVFEGLKSKEGNELINDVIFYYENGVRKKIEHYGDTEYQVTKKFSRYINEGVGPEGIWRYFDKNGNLKKEIIYCIEININSPTKYLILKILKTYGKHGELKKKKRILISKGTINE